LRSRSPESRSIPDLAVGVAAPGPNLAGGVERDDMAGAGRDGARSMGAGTGHRARARGEDATIGGKQP